MMNVDTTRDKQRLDDLFEKTNQLLSCSEFSTDIELQSHWAQYLCIKVCGFTEMAIQRIFFDIAADGSSSREIINFVQDKIKHLHNPKYELILNYVGSFSVDWKNELEEFAADFPETKEALGSLMGNRNLIAHGISVDITFMGVKNWYAEVLNLLKKIEEVCFNH